MRQLSRQKRGKVFLRLFPLLLLASCHTVPTPSPAVRVEYQTVDREVQRPCPVAVPQRPAPLPTPLPSDLGQLAAVLGGKIVELLGPGGYVERADAAIRTCTRVQ